MVRLAVRQQHALSPFTTHMGIPVHAEFSSLASSTPARESWSLLYHNPPLDRPGIHCHFNVYNQERRFRAETAGKRQSLCTAQYGWASRIIISDGPGHVKLCVDASKPDTGSWLKHIQFAPVNKQHNLTACQLDDQTIIL
ncbi:unnamed protein product [Boreogadus saida]